MSKRDRRILKNIKRKKARRLDAKKRFKQSKKPVLSHANLDYEMSEKTQGVCAGGIGAIHELARAIGLDKEINARLTLLKAHLPYFESDHILAMAYTILNGGTCLEDLEILRQDVNMLNAFAATRLPDPTTAGDFLRRFAQTDIRDLIEALLKVTVDVLKNMLPPSERKLAVIDVDGTITPTDAECMAGIDMSYKGLWGYAPLLISLANTGQPLCIVNRPGNAPSSMGAAPWLDLCAQQMLEAYEHVLFRGDTDFSQTKYLDGWHETGRISFIFGYDANATLKALAASLESSVWSKLERSARYEVKTSPRARPVRIKEQLIEQKGYRNVHLIKEDVAEFDYQPGACSRAYRVVVVRKTLEVTQGQTMLLPEVRYFFYITNDWQRTQAQIVKEANQRGNQENLIAQLSGQVHALSTAANTLESNWAWMVIASLAWTLKSWFALFMAEPAEQKRVTRMEFKGFLQRFINIPVQVVRSGRRIILRIVGGHIDSLESFLLAYKHIRSMRVRC